MSDKPSTEATIEPASYYPLKSLPCENVSSGVLDAPSTPSDKSLHQGYRSATPAGSFPITRETARHELLKEAGVLDKAVPMVRKAAERLDEELNAMETKFFSHDGLVKDEREVVAHGARQAAIKQTLELFDVLKSRTEPVGSGRPVQINLIWPNWSSPPVQVVEPQPAVSISVEEPNE